MIVAEEITKNVAIDNYYYYYYYNMCNDCTKSLPPAEYRYTNSLQSLRIIARYIGLSQPPPGSRVQGRGSRVESSDVDLVQIYRIYCIFTTLQYMSINRL